MKRWLAVQTRLEEAVLAYGTLGLALLMVANVLARTLFGTSLTFTEELSKFVVVTVCFVGLSYAASQRRHIRMTAFAERLRPERRRYLEAFVAASTGLLLLVVAGFAMHYVLIVARLGSVSPVLGVPLFVVYLVAPLGFLLSAMQYVGQARRALRGDLGLSSVSAEGSDEDIGGAQS